MSPKNVTGGLFSFIISSDPQYPRTEEGYDTDPEKKKEALDFLIANYSDMQRYRDTHNNRVIPVLVNGDITEFGDKSDEPVGGRTYLTEMKESVFPILGDKNNVLIGLGNHGYDNNVNDSADNGAAGGMLEWFPGAKPRTWVDEDEPPGQGESDENDSNFDWRHNFYDGWTGDIWYVFGSYAYAVEKKDPGLSGATYRFIQLNNYPEYARHFETGSFVGDEHIYNVTPSTGWLALQLQRAAEKRQIVIVSTHQQLLPRAILDLLESSNVTLICVGHTHSLSTSIGGTPQLPIVNSGASFLGHYLIAEAAGESLNIYAVTGNNHSQKTSIGTVPLKVANGHVPQTDIGRYAIFETQDEWTNNIGAYVSLAKGEVYYLHSDGYFNDLVVSCTINRADQGTVITVFDHPGDEDVEGGDFDHYNDDYAVITIKRTLNHPIRIPSFEVDMENDFFSLKTHYVNGLDRKISRVSVKLGSLAPTHNQEARQARNQLKQQVALKLLEGQMDISQASGILDIGPITLRRWIEKMHRAREDKRNAIQGAE
ncbi:metallophosphoesterase [Pseudomonas sp. EMN2]|uniref:metallophosphoesterase n=1 Tax=Pseudomonas sp. EMN2 TaxID=2615212 RepID=UPI0015B39B5E|nr:metallophosphoesterase [Pseudomonas sp. EMN2]